VGLVCASLNARNSIGGYTGIQTSIIYFKSGEAVNMLSNFDPDPNALCRYRQFESFPEILPSNRVRAEGK
jgi:hypothetical protein